MRFLIFPGRRLIRRKREIDEMETGSRANGNAENPRALALSQSSFQRLGGLVLEQGRGNLQDHGQQRQPSACMRPPPKTVPPMVSTMPQLTAHSTVDLLQPHRG